MTKPLAFVMFISSCVSAFCLFLLAYNLMTGDLPFDWKPMLIESLDIQRPIPKKKAVKNAPLNSPGQKARMNEKTINEFYQALVKEKEKLAVEREKLAHEKRVVKEIRTEALKMQDQLAEKEKAVKDLLVRIKTDEKESLKRLATLIAGMDMAQAAEMLMELNDIMASKVLYFMNQKTASQLIAQVLKTKDDEKIE